MCFKEVTASDLMICICSGFNLSHNLDPNGEDQYITKHLSVGLVGSIDNSDNIMHTVL